MYYTYILQLKDKSKYVGYSSDLKKRIKDHNKGLIQSTKNLRPVKLVYYSAFISREKAVQFEKYLKSSSGTAFRNKRLV